jgi:hypothetical protein
MIKRIPPELLPGDFKNGQVLYGEDVNKIITVLREGINFNKYDIDNLIAGDNTAYIVYSITTLNNLIGFEELQEGDFGLVMRDPLLGGVDVYIYNSTIAVWEFQARLSLLDLYLLIDSENKRERIEVSEGDANGNPFDMSVDIWVKVK